MKTRIHKILLCVITLLMFLSAVPPAFAASELTMGVAIDKAGRQRMLTQRMIKAYALIGQKLKAGAESELKSAAALFDSQLVELRAFAANSRERNQIKKISLLWNELQPELATPPSLDKANELNDLAELLLQESHRFVLMLEKRSGTEAGKLVNTSGRQRMLSQRIAKIYLLETWGLGSQGLKDQYSKAVEQFDKALKYLIAAPSNTQAISDELKKVKKNWKIFQISNFSAKYDTRVPSLVVRSMDKILRQMNDITGQYSAL
ncbi:MAG: type IV pili methyl-accepting chemotaxis transducer N-terminal domain-containing protein [gamma proteobacterium symbiont of Bathyaustriella thionipta]|nr:type IV pili methyl-accepting chemotaxis transducer N-terminal domain-containing protein [gamma proteobacterium symbiont of Bathyaustriella thionipta]